MSDQQKKYIFLFSMVIVCVFSDQLTKQWAEHRLSSPSPPIGPPHTFQIEVPLQAEGQALKEFLSSDLTGTSQNQIDHIISGGLLINEKVNYKSDYTLKGGEKLTVTSRRDVEVIEDFFHFRYTRNPGAAFGFLAKSDDSWRKIFFVVVSIISIFVMLGIYYKTNHHQKLLQWSLSFIIGGALGNFIDRIFYGWVIDFIDWHYYREYTWPTFNIADAQITIGVALMAIEIFMQKGENTMEEGGGGV